VLGACGGDDDSAGSTTSTSTAASTTTAPAAGDAADVATADTSIGRVLVDADGRTLYLFANDSSGTSTCTGACAKLWPPATVVGAEVAAGEGLDAADFGTLTRDDGALQLPIGGLPLYRFA
jgi:predicted lipoprotein with Yx(FWY)xxD motif